MAIKTAVPRATGRPTGKPQGPLPISQASTAKAKGKGKAVGRPAPALKSRRRASTSSVEQNDEEGADNDQAAMLAALQAHSRALLGLDGPNDAESSSAAQKRSQSPASALPAGSDDDEQAEEFQSDDGWGADDDFVSDSEDGMDVGMTVSTPAPVAVTANSKSKATVPSVSRVPEVVFAPLGRSATDTLSKAERKAFLVSFPVVFIQLQHGMRS